ncbi:MAG: hypothetical protein SVY15_09880 [Halobacteriota archaeon]|nr:hypothetical protein [Halobacteriota archaeon]
MKKAEYMGRNIGKPGTYKYGIWCLEVKAIDFLRSDRAIKIINNFSEVENRRKLGLIRIHC